MTRTIHAVYEEGVLLPLEDPKLAEHQRVVLEPRLEGSEEPKSALSEWQSVYAGLSEEEVGEVEKIALDRSRFMNQDS